MTGPKRSRAARLLDLLGAAVLIAALVALAKGEPINAQVQPPSPSEPPQSPWPEITTYAVGYARR